jgi:pimeloyl-ACP methyl ester carboxylesterase
MEQQLFRHSILSVNGIQTHLTEAGNNKKQPILFLHGYPENWKEYEKVMTLLKDEYHVLAIDLPGIGSSAPIGKYDKLSVARFVRDLLQILNLKNIILVGHDIGGMITYSFVKHFSGFLSKAVIICTAIPGVHPWEEVKRNPYIWHFAFFSVPELPESLIEGKHPILFEYFYNTLSFNKTAIEQENKEVYINAYHSRHSLETGLGWYRTLRIDEKENSQNVPVNTPILYLKGAKDYGDIGTYIRGFRDNGVNNITGKSIPDCGHFGPEENPEFVSQAVHEFITANR